MPKPFTKITENSSSSRRAQQTQQNSKPAQSTTSLPRSWHCPGLQRACTLPDKKDLTVPSHLFGCQKVQVIWKSSFWEARSGDPPFLLFCFTSSQSIRCKGEVLPALRVTTLVFVKPAVVQALPGESRTCTFHLAKLWLLHLSQHLTFYQLTHWQPACKNNCQHELFQ